VQKYNINNQRVTLYRERLAVIDTGSEAVQSTQNQIVTELLIWSPSKPWTQNLLPAPKGITAALTDQLVISSGLADIA
jgi:hypothetical protein